MLGKAVIATVAVQIAIVMSSLTVPVLASVIAPAVGVPAYLVGYYSAMVYGCAAATSLATPGLVRRWGAIRLHQGMVLMTGLALAALLPAAPAAFVLSALVLGVAYGPMNPASTVLLARFTPPGLRARVFSLKQTAVPVGGALAGFATPMVAAACGWRGAVALLALACGGIAFAIQPWRGALDDDRLPGTRLIGRGFWLPARVLLSTPRLRLVAIASFGFGAVQFAFVAVFPMLLTGIGWTLREAGGMLSLALIVGVVFRIVWGSIADRIGTRPILAGMGLMMTAGAFLTAFLSADWPGFAVASLAALFGLSAFCWAGIGIAETVHQVDAAMIPEASAGVIGLTFAGALAGPALFSTATALTGSFRPAFLLLGVLCGVPSALMLRGDHR